MHTTTDPTQSVKPLSKPEPTSGVPQLAGEPTDIFVTNDQREVIRKTLAVGATDTELELYFYDCKRRGTHPLDRLIHFTRRGSGAEARYTPIVGIDYLRAKSASTGQHVGTTGPEYDGVQATDTFVATVTIHKLVCGSERLFSATARWTEYFPGEKMGFMWRKMPHLMLGKCAEALALRRAFPMELSGLYTKEEMDQADEVVKDIREPARGSLDDFKPGDPATHTSVREPVGAPTDTTTKPIPPPVPDPQRQADLMAAIQDKVVDFNRTEPGRKQLRLILADFKVENVGAVPAEQWGFFFKQLEQRSV